MGLSFTLVLLLLLLQLSSSSGLRSIREDGYGDHQHHHHHPIGKLSEQSPVAASIIQGQCRNPLFFVFGASMVDVGESTAMKPYSQGCNFPPYGLDYFPEPAGRWSNGRLIIDFISKLLLLHFLSSLHHSKHHSSMIHFYFISRLAFDPTHFFFVKFCHSLSKWLASNHRCQTKIDWFSIRKLVPIFHPICLLLTLVMLCLLSFCQWLIPLVRSCH